jgi:hypothetical protein
MNISVIIAAHNAAETIAETLTSLLEQTWPHWEAIVVENASRDATAEVVEPFTLDPRIRLIRLPTAGVSAARNVGIASARGDWLHFLDADDWVHPHFLAHMRTALAGDTQFGAAHCEWVRVLPDGRTFHVADQHNEDDFTRLSRYCAFVPVATLVPTHMVRAVGGFDAMLLTCEDWDLWQRLARAGVRFAYVPELLAYYRVRPASASLQARQLLINGLQVIQRGHGPDPRVPQPLPQYAAGMAPAQLPQKVFALLAWSSALLVGHSADATALLELLPADCSCPELQADPLAVAFVNACLLPRALAPQDWPDVWPTLAPRIVLTLQELERQAQASGVAHQTRLLIERRILELNPQTDYLAHGLYEVVTIEVTQPITALHTRPTVERLIVRATVEGEQLGTLELPVCAGLVPSSVLADAIAASFGWPLLGRYFAQSIYAQLKRRPGLAPAVEGHGYAARMLTNFITRLTGATPGMTSFWRGHVCVASDLPEASDPASPQLHAAAGWIVLLQELWGRPGWSQHHFYNPATPDLPTRTRWAEHGCIRAELAEELPDLVGDAANVTLELTVGGLSIGSVVLPGGPSLWRAQALRSMITTTFGLDLIRVVVRQAILGRPLSAESLRVRLAAAARGSRRI